MSFKLIGVDIDPTSLDFGDAIAKLPKLTANKIMGKFIPSKKRLISIACKNEDDLNDIVYNNYETAVPDYVNNIVTLESEEDPTRYYDIHAYILSYSRMQVMDIVNQIEPDDVCKIKCDAVYVKNPDKYKHLFTISDKIGDWKIEKRRQLSKSMFESQYIDEVKKRKEEFEEEEDNTELLEMLEKAPMVDPKFIEQFIIITALRAGAGKTEYALKKHKPLNSLYIAPTKSLVKSKGTLYDILSATVHRFLGRVPKIFCPNPDKRKIMKEKAERRAKSYSHYSTIIYDEAGMNGKSMLRKVIQKCIKCNQRLIIIHDPKQLNPIHGHSLGDILNYDELKGMIVKEKILKTAHRYLKHNGGQEFVNLLDKYRDQPISQTIQENFKDFQHTNWEQNKQTILTDILDGGIILSPTKRQRDIYNDTLYALTPDTAKIPILVSEPTKGYVKGDRLYIPKTEYQAFTPQLRQKLILAYSATVHITQGDTFIKQIYIDTHRIDFDLNLFYTAITRAERYDQIRVLD